MIGTAILDRYILKKYLTSFFFVVTMMILVICVIDYTEKNEDFITKHVPLKEVIFTYYFNFIPYLGNLLSPIFVFIATIFVTAKLAAHTEIIAMLSSGMSFKRIFVPYILGSTLIAIFIYFLTAWIIPRSNKIRHGFENRYVRGQFFYDARNIHIKLDDKTYMYMESYNNSISSGYNFTLENVNGTQVTEKLKANRITWQPESKKWRIEDYLIRKFNGKAELVTKGQFIDTTLNILPKDFESQHLLYEQLTVDELNAHIKRLKARGAAGVEEYEIEKYVRYSYPFAIIILTLMGVIVSSTKTRKGTGYQIAIGFVLAFVYIFLLIVGRNIAAAGTIHPAMTAWIPNGIFMIIGSIMYWRMPK